MSTSSQGAVLDRMDTTSHPSPGPKGTEPPPSPGPRDEAGAADGGNRPGPSHGDHQSGSSSSSTSAKTASIQGEEDPGAAGVLSGTPQQELRQAHPRPINQPEEVTNMQLSSRLDPQHTSIGSRGSPSPAAFPMSPAPGATPGTLTKSMNDSNVDTSAVTERMDDDTASIGGGDGSGKPSDGKTNQEPTSITPSESSADRLLRSRPHHL